LVVLGLAQLMVVLDVTVVNIALPSAQHDLGFSDADRQWIVTAYTLAFGGLLLLAGRIADLVGRKRIFVIGLVGFALASALGGAAQSFGLLVAARALQGVFGALLAPAALSLLTTTFTDPAQRGKAFGIFGAIGVGGGAVGLLLGGALTEYISWRWCMYINIPIALAAAAGALALLSEQARAARVALDIPGTLTATSGLVALVYGFAQAEADGWGGTSTLGFIALGVVLLAAFVAVQRRVAHPLLPLRIVLDRTRGGAFLALAVNTAALLSVFLFLTYYLQQNLGLSPVMTGLAFLPSPIVTALGATQGATRLARRYGARLVIPGGMALAALGMVLLAPRDELFVTTKLWIQDTGEQATKQAFEASLHNLGLDYLDLYLIHQPIGDVYGSWRAMHSLLADGRVRAIGVSNFHPDRLIDLIDHNDITPAVNQIETHPFYQRTDYQALMRDNSVQIQSWGPFAEGRNNLFTHPLLTEIGNAHGKSVAQVVLRWLIQRDVVVIPKSVRADRMKQNIDVFDFKLTDEQMNQIAAMDTGASLFLDHRDSAVVRQLGSFRIHN
jgi:EmrB/QacA subfamily drug resistance transporter